MKRQIKIFLTAIITGALFVSCTALAADIEAPPKQNMAGSPDATREKFCDLAYNVLKIRMGTELTTKTGMFTDTDEAEINTLAEAGIIDGRGNGIFDPQGKITREEAARILCSMMDYMGIEDTNVVDETFKDFDTVSDWAKEYVAKVGRNEIMEGNGDGYTIDGYNEKTDNYYVNVPRTNFHLYNSDFGPHQNYTVWQTQATLYRLSNRLPEKMEDETVTDLGGGVTLADNRKYTYAEKDGHVTFCMPHGDKHFLVTTEDGQPVLGHDTNVYNLTDGRRLMRLRHGIYEMNNVYIRTEAYYNMGFVGMPPMECHYAYDYDGSFIDDGLMTDNNRAITLTDPDGMNRYIFRRVSSGGYYMTGAYGIEPVISGKESIKQAADKVPYIICTVTRDGRKISQMYNFDGEMLYEHEGEYSYVNSDTIVCFDGDASYAARAQDGEKLFNIKGTTLPRNYITDSYFVTRDENTNLEYLYRFDGGEKDEVCDGFFYLSRWGSFIEVEREGEENTYLLTNDLKRIRVLDGNLIRSEKGYYILKRGNKYVITDKDWNEKVITDGHFIQKDDIIVTYPRNEVGYGEIKAYNADTLELIWNCETTVYDKSDYPQIGETYLLAERDGAVYLYNIRNGASAALEPIETGHYSLSEKSGIAGVDHSTSRTAFNDDTTLYNENCEPLGNFKGGSLEWNSEYVTHSPNIWYGPRYLYDLNGNDMGITADEIRQITVNDRKLIIAYDEYKDYKTKVYDYDTCEYLFTLTGQAGLTYENCIYTKDKDGTKHYFDENGNEIEEPKEE